MIKEIIDIKRRKKKIKIWIAVLSSLFSMFGLLLIFIILIVGIVGGKAAHTFQTNDYTVFSDQVEEYRNIVTEICENEGISNYIDTILAIMQVSSQGIGSDPMCASDKESNTEYGKNRGDIETTIYSIECGVKEFKELLNLCNVTSPDNQAMLSIAYEAYHLNRDYIDFAKEHGGYSSSNAAEFILLQDNLPSFPSPTFSQDVAAYVKLKTNAYKQFIHPLSIYTILQSYNIDENQGEINTSVIYKGSEKQAVLSVSSGVVTDINITDNVSTLTIATEDYIITYWGITDNEFCIGQTVVQGALLGYTSTLFDFDDVYGIELEITKDGESIDPESILDFVTITTQPMDEATQALAEEIGLYARGCVDLIPYKPGGIHMDGVDSLGFIYYVYSNHFNTDTEMNDFVLPYKSFDLLADYENQTYSIEGYVVPNIMYPGDIIFYTDSEGNYDHAAIYVGDSKIVHMTESGCVIDLYNFRVPRKMIRVVGRKYLGLIWPLPGFNESCISSEFSPERINPVTGVNEAHNGTDIAAPKGTIVIASKDGTVISSGWSNSAGYNIIIEHGDGIYTYYMHGSQLLVESDTIVKQGDEIMLVGSTGQSTGNHLHFGLRINGEFVNAMDYCYSTD